jgi:hypothetical protein
MDLVTEEHLRRIPERAKRELIRGEQARAQFAIHAQNQIKRAFDAGPPTRHIEGIGQKLCTITAELAARMRVKYGVRCLHDIDFVNALLRDNPFLRTSSTAARLTLRVNGWRDRNQGSVGRPERQTTSVDAGALETGGFSRLDTAHSRPDGAPLITN